SVSLVDYMELLESGLNRSGAGDLVIDEEGNIVPAPKPRSFLEEPKNLEPVLSMIATSPATFKSVVTEDFGETNVLVRTNLSGSRRIEQTLARIHDWVAAHFPAELRVHATGNLVLLSGTTSDIVAGQIKSLSLALGIIFVVLALMFLSARIGFFAITFSSFVPIQNFGILTGFTMAASLGANLVLLPALLATTKVITLWDLVGVKLGQQPARTIPLFAGLRPAQARIVVLMGELRRFAPGEMV